jgi:hypothetical protein
MFEPRTCHLRISMVFFCIGIDFLRADIVVADSIEPGR